MPQLALIAQAPRVIEFSVAGEPVPQGSKIALISGKRVRKGREVWVRNPIASLVDSANRKTKLREAGRLNAWKAKVERRAKLVAPEELWSGDVRMECEFVYPRPDAHFTKSGRVRAGAPRIPGYDLDKTVRAVRDALEGIIYTNDRNVVKDANSKRWATEPGKAGGVLIRVEHLLEVPQ